MDGGATATAQGCLIKFGFLLYPIIDLQLGRYRIYTRTQPACAQGSGGLRRLGGPYGSPAAPVGR